MSEGNKEEKVEVKEDIVEDKVTDEKKDEKLDIVEVNVALLKAESMEKDRLIAELTVALDAMTLKYGQAKDLIEQDSRASLIAELAPKTTVPDHILAMKPIDELLEMKRVLADARVPAFKSGTPVITDKVSPRAKLASMYDDYAAKTWRKN